MPEAVEVQKYPKSVTKIEQVKARAQEAIGIGAKSVSIEEDATHWILVIYWV